MSDELKILHDLIPTKPKLREADGMQIVMSGDHTTQFACDAEAQFFVKAYEEVPGLLDELERRRASDQDARITFLEKALEISDDTNKLLEDKLAATEQRLTDEVKRRTEAQTRGRRLAQALVRMQNALGK